MTFFLRGFGDLLSDGFSDSPWGQAFLSLLPELRRRGDLLRYRLFLQAVSTANRIGVVGKDSEPVAREIAFEGRVYRLAGPALRDETLWWAPYEAVPAGKTGKLTS